jgi:hypothetical protein
VLDMQLSKARNTAHMRVRISLMGELLGSWAYEVRSRRNDTGVILTEVVSRDSAVGIETGYGLDGRGSEFES